MLTAIIVFILIALLALILSADKLAAASFIACFLLGAIWIIVDIWTGAFDN